MLSQAMVPLTIFLVAALCALVTTPLVMRVALRWGAVDVPRDRHQHPLVMPKLGGIPLAVGFLLALGVSLLLPVARNDAADRKSVV